MFSFLNAPLERRMFALIWPRTEELRAAIPEGHSARAHPVVLQATIAIPNLAVAATLLFRGLPREKAHATTAKIEEFIFELIATDQGSYTVSEVLKLASEQRAWQMEAFGLAANPSTQSNLDTIIRVVYSSRFLKYQDECQKGFLMATKNQILVGDYGPLGFVAKRFLSDITGHPILRVDDLSEECFDNLGLMSCYFNNMFRTLAEEMKR